MEADILVYLLLLSFDQKVSHYRASWATTLTFLTRPQSPSENVFMLFVLHKHEKSAKRQPLFLLPVLRSFEAQIFSPVVVIVNPAATKETTL